MQIKKCAVALCEDLKLREGEVYCTAVKEKYCTAGGIPYSQNRAVMNYWVNKLSSDR